MFPSLNVDHLHISSCFNHIIIHDIVHDHVHPKCGFTTKIHWPIGPIGPQRFSHHDHPRLQLARSRRLPGSQKLGMARGSPLPGGEKCHGDITASQIVDNDIFNDVMVIL